MSKSWMTRDGRWIKIKKMTDDHLLNTLAMLVRCARREKFMADVECISWHSDGEIASDEIEQTEIWDKGYDEYLPAIFHDLKAEAARRGLAFKG